MPAAAALGLAQILVWGGSFFLLAVLADPIHRDTGWSHTAIYAGLTAGLLVSAALSTRATRWIERGHGRALLLGSGWVIAAGMAVVGGATHYAVFVAGWCVIGVGMAGALYDPLFAMLGTVYGANARAGINLVTLIGGFATTLTWPAQAWMEAHLGWRGTCWAYAAVMALAIVPMYRLTLPGARAGTPPAPTPPQVGAPTAAATTPHAGVDAQLYRLLSAVFSIAAILMTAVSVQVIVLLQASGRSTASAIALAALIGPSMVVVRVASLALQRLHPTWMGLISPLCVAAGLLLMSAWPEAAAAGIVAYGVGNGLRALVRGTLPLAVVPREALAGVMGRLARSSLVCQALTPLACGFGITQFGAAATLWGMAALAAANAVLALRLHARVLRLHPAARLRRG